MKMPISSPFSYAEVGLSNRSIQITQTIASIELLEQQIEEIKTLIEDTMKELDSVIMTIPGIGAMEWRTLST